MDDDKDAGVMQMPDGSLYLSTAAAAGPDQTKTTIRDCDGVCRALFGAALSMESGGVGLESWKTDRPMRKGGFNIGASKGPHWFVSVDNSGHGGLVWRLVGLVLLELWMPWLVRCLYMLGGRGG